MKSIGKMLTAILFGCCAGIVATLILFNIGDNTDEVIYGASVPMTRFFVLCICSLSCVVAESIADSSAREVLVGIIISTIVSLLFVKENFLDYEDKMESMKNMITPICVSVIVAALFSYPIMKIGKKFLEWTPFAKDVTKD